MFYCLIVRAQNRRDCSSAANFEIKSSDRANATAPNKQHSNPLIRPFPHFLSHQRPRCSNDRLSVIEVKSSSSRSPWHSIVCQTGCWLGIARADAPSVGSRVLSYERRSVAYRTT
nr:hypothetical protein CFP56_74953 [Quercus suber]